MSPSGVAHQIRQIGQVLCDEYLNMYLPTGHELEYMYVRGSIQSMLSMHMYMYMYVRMLSMHMYMYMYVRMLSMHMYMYMYVRMLSMHMYMYMYVQ